MPSSFLNVVPALFISLAAITADGAESKNINCLITSRSIAGIELGTPLSEVTRILPGSTLKRTSDGDGVALVAVVIGKRELLVIDADEPDRESEFDLSKQVQGLETFDRRCKTKEGIGPGSPTWRAAQKYGGIYGFERTMIESREYVEFRRPPGMSFRTVNQTELSGWNFTEYLRNSRILSVGL